MAQTQRVDIKNFGGGVNSEFLTHEIAPSENPDTLRNVRIDGNSKAPRPGYTTFTSSLGNNNLRGIYGWDRDAEVNDRLVSVYQQDVYLTKVSSETRGTAIQTSQTVDSVNNFSNWKDWAFLFNGNDEIGRLSETAVTFDGVFAGGEVSGTLLANWTGITGDYDITFSNGDERVVTLTNGADTATWTVALTAAATVDATTVAYDEPATKPDSITNASDFTPSFGAMFLNSLIVGGVPTARNTFFISKPGSSANPEDIYDFSGAINDGNADEVAGQSRGTAVVEMSGFAVLFNIDGAAIITGFKDLGTKVVPDLQPIKGADGCVNQKSAVVVGNDVYYLTPKKQIRSIRKGFDESITAETKPMSFKINKFLKNNLDDSFYVDSNGYYDRDNKLIKFHVRSVGSLFPDLVIVGDISELDENGDPRWTIDDGKPFMDGIFFKNKSLTASANIGQLFEDEVGLADYNDVPIPTLFETKSFVGNSPTTRKRYRNVNVYGYITEATSLNIIVYVDDVEAANVTVNSDNITSDNDSGIAVEAVGEFAVGDDDVKLPSTNLIEFVERIPFRSSGRKIKCRFITNQINGNYLISVADYDAIVLGKQNVKISEKL